MPLRERKPTGLYTGMHRVTRRRIDRTWLRLVLGSVVAAAAVIAVAVYLHGDMLNGEEGVPLVAMPLVIGVGMGGLWWWVRRTTPLRGHYEVKICAVPTVRAIALAGPLWFIMGMAARLSLRHYWEDIAELVWAPLMVAGLFGTVWWVDRRSRGYLKALKERVEERNRRLAERVGWSDPS